MEKLEILWWGIILIFIMASTAPVFAQAGEVILNPGRLLGSVTITGYEITQIKIMIQDKEQIYSSTISENVAEGAKSIDFQITVEGNRDYYVMAEATILTDEYTGVIFPVYGPVTIPVFKQPGDEATLDISIEPAVITGKISTPGRTNTTLDNYNAWASIYIPETDVELSNHNYMFDLSEPGVPGKDYTLLVAPDLDYNWYINVNIDGINYYSGAEKITAPAAGEVLYKNFVVDVTAASISGTATLLGMHLNGSSVSGFATNPYRYNSIITVDETKGFYSFDADAGTWFLKADYYYNLPGELNNLTGHLSTKYLVITDIVNGEGRSGTDFVIDPGFIPGKLNLWGANVDFESAIIEAHSSSDGASSYSQVSSETGRFMYVCSPDDWKYGYAQNMFFVYPSDPDESLKSSVSITNASMDTITVNAGQTTPEVDLTYGTATIKYYFSVADQGMLSNPYITARKTQPPFSRATGYGSGTQSKEGQAIVTLLLPGEYIVEAYGTVNGSKTEFGYLTINVNEGDVIVIDGTNRPAVKVTNPVNHETFYSDEINVPETTTDTFGITSITINGMQVPFTSTDTHNNPNEVTFSHETASPVTEDNSRGIGVTDKETTGPLLRPGTVISHNFGPE